MAKVSRSRPERTVVSAALAVAVVGTGCLLPAYELSEKSASGGGGSSSTSGAGGAGAGASGGAGGESLRALGQTCDSHTVCETGLCVDGVCCESACTSLCSTCSVDKGSSLDGRCELIPEGMDPDDECDDACLSMSLVVIACKAGACDFFEPQSGIPCGAVEQ